MSPLELVDDRYDKLARELRAARSVAPVELRERVLSLAPPPPPRFQLSLRPLAPAVALAGLAAALGVAVVLGIVHGSSQTRLQATRPPQAEIRRGSAAQEQKRVSPTPKPLSQDSAQPFGVFAPSHTRLQRYDAFLRVRVRDQDELSRHTQDALRQARRVGGYVVWARYAAPTRTGDSELLLRIPVENVQAAIAAFAGYGTLVRQRIVLKDLQQRVDSLSARIARLRREIARIADNPALRERLRQDRKRLAGLTAQKSSAVKRAQLATVALTMVVGAQPAAAHGRFRRTIDDAASVLARELEIVLYGALVAGPLLLLGAAGIVGGRSLRRRADRHLLERS